MQKGIVRLQFMSAIKWKRGHRFSWFYSKLVILLLLAVIFFIYTYVNVVVKRAVFKAFTRKENRILRN